MTNTTNDDLADAAWQIEEWRRRRDQLIIRAHRRGDSLRKIAVDAGVSHEGVKKILVRHGIIV